MDRLYPAATVMLAFAACGDGDGDGDTLLTGVSGFVIFVIVCVIIWRVIVNRRV